MMNIRGMIVPVYGDGSTAHVTWEDLTLALGADEMEKFHQWIERGAGTDADDNGAKVSAIRWYENNRRSW